MKRQDADDNQNCDMDSSTQANESIENNCNGPLLLSSEERLLCGSRNRATSEADMVCNRKQKEKQYGRKKHASYFDVPSDSQNGEMHEWKILSVQI